MLLAAILTLKNRWHVRQYIDIVSFETFHEEVFNLYLYRPSIRPYVTLVDCDHTVNEKWKSAHHGGIVRRIGYTYVQNPTRIVVYCDLKFYWRRPVGGV